MKRTYQPSKLVRKRRHGFRARMATVGGRRVLAARRVPWAQAPVRLSDHAAVGEVAIVRLRSAASSWRRRAASRLSRDAFVLQALTRPEPERAATIGLGITVTRKIGGAVVRNRARRRLREALRLTLPGPARARRGLCGRGAAGGAELSVRSAAGRARGRVRADRRAAAGGDEPRRRDRWSCR